MGMRLTFIFSLVGQHWSVNAVPNGIDTERRERELMTKNLHQY